MATDDFDRIDEGILALLRGDARNVTTASIADELGLAASTVATRISSLEDSGVITGYWPAVDYERLGYDHSLLLTGTITDECTEGIDAVRDVDGVLGAQKLMADASNVVIHLVARSQRDVETKADELGEVGIEILGTEVVEQCIYQPGSLFHTTERSQP